MQLTAEIGHKNSVTSAVQPPVCLYTNQRSRNEDQRSMIINYNVQITDWGIVKGKEMIKKDTLKLTKTLPVPSLKLLTRMWMHSSEVVAA